MSPSKNHPQRSKAAVASEPRSHTIWSYASAISLGLLSSSCCVIQLILNAFSIGCAGFSLLTPFRPLFLSLTLLLIIYTFFKHGWSSRATTLTVTASLILALTPEMVSVVNRSSANSWDLSNQRLNAFADVFLQYWTPGQLVSTKPGSTKTVLQWSTNHSPETLIKYEVQIDGMACEACANRLRQYFNKHKAVEHASVFFDKGRLELWTRSGAGALVLSEEAIQDMVAEVDTTYKVRLLG
ncbi:hypothetical protein BGZ51_006751, partial [Haplosporangium sp. Z 767]